jgi:hypothetical protein
MRRSLDPRRVFLLIALYALTFVVALPPGVCFCELEGGSCCGPLVDLGEPDGAAGASGCADACCAPEGERDGPLAPGAEPGAPPLDAAPPVPLT